MKSGFLCHRATLHITRGLHVHYHLTILPVWNGISAARRATTSHALAREGLWTLRSGVRCVPAELKSHTLARELGHRTHTWRSDVMLY